MLDAVLDAVVSALNAAGAGALRQFPDAPLSRDAGPVICVGMKRNKLVSAGAGDYMGERTEGGTVSEVYGYRMEPVLALDIYSPDGGEYGAAGCLSAAAAVGAALPNFPAGIKPRALTCGETAFDTETGMFHMPAELSCAAFLTRELDAQTGEFTNFVLKGVLG